MGFKCVFRVLLFMLFIWALKYSNKDIDESHHGTMHPWNPSSNTFIDSVTLRQRLFSDLSRTPNDRFPQIKIISLVLIYTFRVRYSGLPGNRALCALLAHSTAHFVLLIVYKLYLRCTHFLMQSRVRSLFSYFLSRRS